MAEQRHILVVDDEPYATRVLKLKLQGEGYAVSVACDGQEALERIRERDFDAVVTDICMPRMSGRELTETVRSELPEREAFIFVSSSRPEEEARAWTRDLPRVAFIEKPLSLRRLAERLRALFEKGDQEPEA